jgi:hypothetical protein
MTSTSGNAPYSPYNKHHGPHPGILATIYSLLFILGLVSYSVLSHGASYPRPQGSLEDAQHIFLHFPDALQFNALFQFGAAIPLGLFTAAVTSRLSFLGVNVTGVSIALYGGIAASILLILSGISTWVLSQPGIAGDLAVMHALQLLGFCCGGVANIVTFGLLMAGIAVPCLFGRYTPRWLAWMGLILAGLAALSTLSMVIPQLTLLLPIVRFPGCIWMIGTGFTLTRNRPVPARSGT